MHTRDRTKRKHHQIEMALPQHLATIPTKDIIIDSASELTRYISGEISMRFQSDRGRLSHGHDGGTVDEE